MANEEKERLEQARSPEKPWRKWGPYLSERQWGTVREDLSPGGDAWNYVSHDASRAWAYRWGEDGLAGISDDRQLLCFALALWNEKDPILKERLFGLTNSEGNHGEDVKEYYFYLDSTPTHSYMKYLYKYPQRAYPYQQLLDENRRRSRQEFEYELLDTGVFEDDRYFDVFVEYAKCAPEDMLIEVTVHNRGPQAAPIHILPTLWFRNTWGSRGPRPKLWAGEPADRASVIAAEHPLLGRRYLTVQPGGELLFVDNDTNRFRFPQQQGDAKYYKDGFHFHVVEKNRDAVNPERTGTKASAHYTLTVPAQGSVVVRLRLSDRRPADLGGDLLGSAFDDIVRARRAEADDFYAETIPATLSADQKHVVRQALAGMLWSKQFYYYDVATWIRQHGVSDPYNDGHGRIPRNGDWYHMVGGDVISMPDKWEYPWYAAWDLAFHVLPLGMIDPDLAKRQLLLLLQDRYLHPNGQVPAYEWNFGDVNPPVHAWAGYFLYQFDHVRGGKPDLAFLKTVFHKLLLNFTWWVNRKDPSGRNVFQGGFLGLDNIGVFDRSAALPTGGHLEQADGTAWMALYSQVMLQMAIELALDDPSYGEMALKFFEHFIWIASAMTHIGGERQMWDEDDGFFYDVLCAPDGRNTRLKVQSMVGLLPLAAATVFTGKARHHLPEVLDRARWFIDYRPELVTNTHDPRKLGLHDRVLLAILGGDRLRRVLAHMLDENEFLSPYGIRSLSARHRSQPYLFWAGGQTFSVGYLPAESDSAMFGGNSNWRGPIWLPLNAILIRALVSYYAYYGDDFTVEMPTGSGRRLTLYQVAEELTQRLGRLFTRDQRGRRPVHGGTSKFRDDPHWKDHLLFYEYFHGDNGAGIGASHQTGWTGLVAALLGWFAVVKPSMVLDAAVGTDTVSLPRLPSTTQPG